MRRRSGVILLLGLLAVALVALWRSRPAPAPTLAARLEVTKALGGAAAGFARADRARAFAFPADHGAHEGFRTEWWYVTGNLADGEGRAFGYQLTFFRQALAPAAPVSPSAWRSSRVWMAHFALTDAAGRRFRASERFAREALDLAGARSSPFRVHVEDWELAAAAGGFAPLRIHVIDGDAALDLELTPSRPPLLQGEDGLSRKGPEPGDASYYYSLPRLLTRGTLTVDGTPYAVSGLSWLDREWSTSALAAGLVGWDWLAMHLDDGSDLMLYRLRRADGSSAPESSGTLARANGSIVRFRAARFTMTPVGHWTSPRGVDYPASWRVALPGLELLIEPLLADQELDLSVRYWEGAVRARGSANGLTIGGSGYLEMTGYGETAGGDGRRAFTGVAAR